MVFPGFHRGVIADPNIGKRIAKCWFRLMMLIEPAGYIKASLYRTDIFPFERSIAYLALGVI